MKKLLFIILFLASIIQINAQCDEDTLYEYLLAGKIVVVDFYLLTCGSCMGSAPCIETLYQNYGQNTGDVIVLAFDVGEGNSTDEVADEWAQEYGMPNVPNFSQMGGEQNTSSFWGEFYSGCGENGGFAQTYVVTGNFCCGDPSALNYSTGCYGYCGDNTCCIYDENDTPPLQGVTYWHQGGVVNCNQITAHIDTLLEQMVSLDNEYPNTERNLIKVIDVLGREGIKNKLQLEIYDDGSVEKKYIIKY